MLLQGPVRQMNFLDIKLDITLFGLHYGYIRNI